MFERLSRNDALHHEHAQGAATRGRCILPIERVPTVALRRQPLQRQWARRPRRRDSLGERQPSLCRRADLLLGVVILSVVFVVHGTGKEIGHVAEDEPGQEHLLELGGADDVLWRLAVPEIVPRVEHELVTPALRCQGQGSVDNAPLRRPETPPIDVAILLLVEATVLVLLATATWTGVRCGQFESSSSPGSHYRRPGIGRSTAPPAPVCPIALVSSGFDSIRPCHRNVTFSLTPRRRRRPPGRGR